jgi:hypothetical protein
MYQVVDCGFLVLRCMLFLNIIYDLGEERRTAK